MIQVHYKPGARKTAVALLGQLVPDEQLAALAGALDGATVHLSAHGDSLFFDVQHPDVVFQQRRLARDELGRLYVRNLYLEKQPWGQPLLGLRALLRQIEAGQALGIAYLTTFASGSAYEDGWNGYYTWARYGFDAELPARVREELPPSFASVRTLNELLQQGGAPYWKKHGLESEMIFDLRPNSSTIQTLQGYLAHLRKEGRWS